MIDDNFEQFAVNIDSDCVEQDFDEFDLWGDKVEESDDDFGDDIELN